MVELFASLSQNPNGCPVLSQEDCKLTWLVFENNEKATLNINMPYWYTQHGCGSHGQTRMDNSWDSQLKLGLDK